MKSFFTKAKKMPLGVKASFAYIIASIIQQGLNFIATPIYTRLLSTSDMGGVNSYSTYSSIIGTVVGLGLVTGSFSIGMKEFPKERDQYVSSVFSLSVISAAAALLLIVFFRTPLSNLMGVGTEYLVLMCLGLIFNPGKSMWLARNRYELKYKISIFVTLASAFLIIIVSVLAILRYRDDPSADLAFVRLASSAAVSIVFSIIIDLRILLKGRKFINLKYWGFALRTSLPLLVHSLAKVIFDGSDRIMILKMVGKSEVGIYGTLYIFSSISLILWQAINGSLVPFIFSKMQANSYREIRKVCNSLLLIYAVACVILMLLAPDAVRIMTTEEYLQGIYIMPPVAAGIFLTALYNMYSTVILYYKKTKLIMYATSVAAAVNVILNYFMIPIFGYIAAAYTTLFSFVVLAGMQYMFMRSVQAGPDFYDEKVFLGLSVLVLICSIFANFLYINDLCRYIIIIILIGISAFNYKKILAEIQKIRN